MVVFGHRQGDRGQSKKHHDGAFLIVLSDLDKSEYLCYIDSHHMEQW